MAEQTPPISTQYVNVDHSSAQVQNRSPTHSGTLNPPFTPRSSTFPDPDYDSDEGSTVFVPTPIHSPGGPRYDDLPPSYDEAQREALEQARAGMQMPSEVNNLEIHRLVLEDSAREGRPQTQRSSALLDDPNAYEFEPEEKGNANAQATIPVINTRERDNTAPVDPAFPLLNHALEFTKHEPDADVRYAPRLTRCIAIPQEISTIAGPAHRCGRHGRRHGRDDGERHCRGGGRGRGRHGDECRRRGRRRHSHERPDETFEPNPDPQENAPPAQFIRAYSKALHAHSIRSAEFADFLDGLNALCLATNSTSTALLQPLSDINTPVSLVHNYINSTNEAFFAPRGLRVSLQPLSALLTTLKIPEERGQRSAAVASASDPQATAEQRALALYPWIEKLDKDLPEATSRMMVLKEMGQKFQELYFSKAQEQEASEASVRGTPGDNSNTEQAPDPPHSVPEPGAGSTGHEGGRGRGNPFGGSFGGPGAGSPWNGHQMGWNWAGGMGGMGGRGGRGGWSRGPGFGYGPPNAWGHQWGSRGGHSGFGWDPSNPLGNHHGGRGGHRAHHGPPGFGWDPHNHSSHHCGGRGWGAGQRGWQGPEGSQSWAAWGEALGKWGEELGKRMGEMGQEFGNRVGGMGQEFGRRVEESAEEFGARVERAAAGGWSAADEPDLQGQDTGVIKDEEKGEGKQEEKMDAEKSNNKAKDKAKSKAKKGNVDSDDDDDSDTSSVSSFSSDSDSDSDSDLGEKYPHEIAENIFLKRIREINNQAATATAKGKKPASVIASERDAAIANAEAEKTALELKIEKKKMKWEIIKELKQKKKGLKEQHRLAKKEIRESGGGKRERKAELKAYKEQKKGQKREAREAKMAWKRERRRGRDGWKGHGGRWGKNFGSGEAVWVVVENLGD